MNTKKDSYPKKRIVYLFGTGATQAELLLHSGSIRILMKDIKDGIIRKIKKEEKKLAAEKSKNESEKEAEMNDLSYIRSELSDDRTDVEHLISLYESSSINKYKVISNKLKKFFWAEIQEKINILGDGFEPKLMTALLDMHEIPEFDEELVGILTINYEDLLERAVQKIKNRVNYSIDLNSKHSYLKIGKNNVDYPVLKLHGSFNWKNDFPIILSDENDISNEDVLWIPPGIEKSREKYPFSIIWGRAKEILNCDVLRIIGCSLNRNDWHLVELLYTTKKFNSSDNEYIIELIDFTETANEIGENYPYLQIQKLSELREIREYFTNSFLKHSNKTLDKKSIDKLCSKDSRTNIFETWIRAKGEDILNRGIKIRTNKKIFEKYIKEV